MATKSNLAKDNVIEKIKEIFGDDYIGEYDKKYFVWSNDGSNRTQIAITLTCPKNPVNITTSPAVKNGMMNFEELAAIATTPPPATMISDEERENIVEMMRRLGL